MVDCGLCLTVDLKSLIIAAGSGEFTASIGKNGLNLPDFNMHKITAAVSALGGPAVQREPRRHDTFGFENDVHEHRFGTFSIIAAKLDFFCIWFIECFL